MYITKKSNHSLLASEYMKHIFNITLLCLYFFISSDVNAQDIEFRHLSTADGLTHFSVISLYQDERDFIWCGTRNGVSLYNGREFKEYRYHKGDTTSLFCNTITAITGDRAGHVFLHTVLGIALFDMTLDKFSVLFKGEVSAMLYDNQLYFACNNIIYTYESGKIKQHYELPDRTNQIVSLSRNDGRLYIGTESNGLYILVDDGELQHPIQKGKIGSLFRDSRKRLWAGSWDSGLYQISNDSIVHYSHQPEEAGSISSDFVRVCCEDSQGHIWIGTFNGLNRFDEKTKTFVSYLRRENESESIYSSVWSLLCDHQGTLWIGTYYGGLCCINPQKEIFHHFHTSRQERKGLSFPTVGKMIEDNQNNIWICTDGGGLNMYDPQSGNFKWYFHSDSRNSISHDNIKAFWYDSGKDVLWIGTHLGGLSRLDLKTGIFANYYAKESRKGDLRTNIISTIVPYKGKFILATQGGVMLFDPVTGSYEQLFSGPDGISTIQRVNNLLIDHRDILWIVGSDGIYSYRFEDGKMTYYQSDPLKPGTLCSPHIHSFYLDSQNNLWVCSADSGMDLYDYETDSFENFSGLSGNCVYGMCELHSGNLLALTNRGLSLLKFKKDTGLVVLSEWAMKTINENSVYQSEDSTIYIGRADGMISFKESDLLHPSIYFHIFPYRLLVNGHEVEVGDDTGILEESITVAKKVVLKSSQSVFTIGYAASNYLPGEPEHLVYQLKGFSDTWTPLRDSREITYTNLKPGNYTLIVKSVAPTGDMIPESLLGIEILPPWYLTIWAYLFYVAVTVLVSYYLIRVYHNRIQLQESLKYERQHTHDVEELNQSKLRFFTNVSHEFRTPLTLIIGQMETLLQGKLLSPPVYQKFFSIYKNSIQLKELISELLDFRKQEQGYMKMKVCENDIAGFLYENYLLFKEYADTKGIKMIFEKPDKPVCLWYNAKQMQKVVNNILSNALKYTSRGGAVTLSVREDENEVVIEIADNGCGVDSQEVEKIFDRFYQSNPDDSGTGTGVGLALTKSIVELHGGTIKAAGAKGEGMTFTICLRKGKEHFMPEQLEEENPVVDVTGDYSQDYRNEEMPLPLLLDDDMTVEDEIVQEKENDLKMLVVEDNKQLRELLVQIFTPFYSVVSAEDGEEGLEKVRTESFNIVISDIVMPRLSGIELCKEIKNNMETCHIPVILLTARTGVEHNLEGLRIGADDYITKPFNVPILISRCNNIVKNRFMLQEKFSKQPLVGPQALASNPLDKEFLDEVIEIIEKHLSDSKFNVDILVSEMLIGRTRLFHKLKAITGQTPSDFISNIRLKKAAFWLKNNPEFNISEIAYRTGYTSARYFSKNFKEKYGLIPSEYRKESSVPEPDMNESVFE